MCGVRVFECVYAMCASVRCVCVLFAFVSVLGGGWGQ